ncbi:pseudouridine synthase [Aquabacterium sp. A7-Y]|uniref:pseudouridine synthase n=1 Tax=Aquabacterium sp. A7-Y TaxID=1349605 RepID=UPI00223E838B|nr:pseudouridine synthase [Aquabacterium sp. A7-Y]MCW7542049.1 pseudouridine synthase [Aquabacterium sp. A7-Y]
MGRVRPDCPLPTRDGVSPSCLVLPAGCWPRLADFLAVRLPAVSREGWLERLRRGEVADAEGRPLPPDAPYRPHLRIWYYRSLEREHRVPFEAELLFRDDLLVAVDKPHFLPVTPSGRYLQETLLVRLKRKLGIETLSPVHRIDRETAGVVLFTLQPRSRDAYQSLFRERLVVKHYEAVAPWRPEPLPEVYRSRLVEGDSFMTMREAPGEPNAETAIELLDVRGELALYRLSPVTGQKHQLRAHMAALGRPILHDQIYPRHLPEPDPDRPPDYSRPLQLLARELGFLDPLTGEWREFRSRRELTWGRAEAAHGGRDTAMA